MSLSMSMSEFVAGSETLLAQRGTIGAAFVNGTLYRNAKTLNTPGLTLAQCGDKGLEISIKYFTEKGGICNNPVYCRLANGEVIRTHGEWKYGIKRLQRLLAGETPTEAITLGHDENGRTDGLN